VKEKRATTERVNGCKGEKKHNPVWFVTKDIMYTFFI